MKRIFRGVMLLLVLLILCVSVTALDLSPERHGDNTCGEDLVWSLSGTTLTISGTGPMTDYSYSEPAPWDAYADAVVHVVLEEGVTTVGSNAFNQMEKILDISLPESLTSIGDSAFYYCSVLSGVKIPEGVTQIGDSAFYRCDLMDSVTIPAGVTALSDDIFSGCGRLAEVTLPEGLTALGSGVFSECAQLKAVNLPASLITMGDNPFRGCKKLENITVSGNNFRYENGLLLSGDGKRLIWISPKAKTVALPDTLTEIGGYAFYECVSLSRVELPGSVKVIGGNAFKGCVGLKELLIPATVAEIGNWSLENGEYGGYTEDLVVYYGGDQVGWGALTEDAFLDTEGLSVVYDASELPPQTQQAPQVTPQVSAAQPLPEETGGQENAGEEAVEGSAEKESTPLGLILGCGGAVILVVGIALAAVLGNKRKKANV